MTSKYILLIKYLTFFADYFKVSKKIEAEVKKVKTEKDFNQL